MQASQNNVNPQYGKPLQFEFQGKDCEHQCTLESAETTEEALGYLTSLTVLEHSQVQIDRQHWSALCLLPSHF